jgi:hypothetical protein
MTDPYPNSSANTIYTHLLSLSNTFADFGDTVTSLSVSTILSTTPDSTMPSFTRPGSIRRRFLRIISFGRYSNGSTDDTEHLPEPMRVVVDTVHQMQLIDLCILLSKAINLLIALKRLLSIRLPLEQHHSLSLA